MQKVITVAIIVLVALGFGFYLFTISPQNPSSSEYNSALNVSGVSPLDAPPAFNPEVDHYIGNPQAKNVFIEYADMQCPACAAYSELLKEVPTQFTDTVYVMRYYPLVQIHQNAVISSLAAEAAGAQGKYWEMSDVLFKTQPSWQTMTDPLETFVGYAKEAGVNDIELFKNDIISKKYLPKIQEDSNQALGLNLPGTPSFFFNGHKLENQDVAGMKKQSEAFLNK